MSKFIIKGGVELDGEVKIAGNKNSALKLIPAALLGDSVSILTNVPTIRDVDVLLEIIEKLGAKVEGRGTNTISIDPSGLKSYEPDSELSVKIRASVVLAAPLLAKFGKTVITPPGGDQIGERLLDTHFTLMQAMGVKINKENGQYLLNWEAKKNSNLFLEEASVTATEMGLILASATNNQT